MTPPTWRTKDVVGNHGHLWDQRPLASSTGGRHVAQKAEERGAARQRSHGQFYPGLGHHEALKILLLLWWIDGGNMVVVTACLPSSVALGRNGYVRMKYEGVDLLKQGPTLSKVASGLLL